MQPEFRHGLLRVELLEVGVGFVQGVTIDAESIGILVKVVIRVAVLKGVIVIRTIIEGSVEVVVLVVIIIEVVVFVVEVVVVQFIVIELVFVVVEVVIEVVIEVVHVAAVAPRLLKAACRIGDRGERVTEDGARRYRQ